MAPGSPQRHHRQDSRGQVGVGNSNGCTQLAAHTLSSCLALRPLLTNASPLRQCHMPTLVLHPHPAREQTSTLPSLLPLQTVVGRRGQSSRSWRGQFPGPGKVPADGRWHDEGVSTPELSGTACRGVVPQWCSQSGCLPVPIPPHCGWLAPWWVDVTGPQNLETIEGSPVPARSLVDVSKMTT